MSGESDGGVSEGLGFFEKMADRGFEYLVAGGGMALILYGLLAPTGARITGNELIALMILGGMLVAFGLVAFFVKQFMFLEGKKLSVLRAEIEEVADIARNELRNEHDKILAEGRNLRVQIEAAADTALTQLRAAEDQDLQQRRIQKGLEEDEGPPA